MFSSDDAVRSRYDVVDRVVGQRFDLRSVANATGRSVTRAVVAAGCNQCSQRDGEAADLQCLAATDTSIEVAEREGSVLFRSHAAPPEMSRASAVLPSISSRLDEKPAKLVSTAAWRDSTVMIEAVKLIAWMLS